MLVTKDEALKAMDDWLAFAERVAAEMGGLVAEQREYLRAALARQEPFEAALADLRGQIAALRRRRDECAALPPHGYTFDVRTPGVTA